VAQAGGSSFGKLKAVPEILDNMAEG